MNNEKSSTEDFLGVIIDLVKRVEILEDEIAKLKESKTTVVNNTSTEEGDLQEIVRELSKSLKENARKFR